MIREFSGRGDLYTFMIVRTTSVSDGSHVVKLTKICGGEGPSREKLEEALDNGESYGFMSLAERTADETIVALDDKHLVAYMSIYIEGGQVFASTVVRYHNKLGVVYFNLIRPFHVLVVKNLFKQMMRERGF